MGMFITMIRLRPLVLLPLDDSSDKVLGRKAIARDNNDIMAQQVPVGMCAGVDDGWIITKIGELIDLVC